MGVLQDIEQHWSLDCGRKAESSSFAAEGAAVDSAIVTLGRCYL
jgi:hypothetical protein